MKMKKSKVIVPALGLLLLSTAASVTGTVAWFTANKSVEIDAGNFAVVSTTGDLKFEAAAGFGTRLNASDDTLVEPKTDTGTVAGVAETYGWVLSDASFNHNTGIAYYPYANGSMLAAHSKAYNADDATEADFFRQSSIISETGDPVTARTVNKVYSIFTWSYTFKFTSENGATVGLFLDFDNSSVTDLTTTNNSDSYKGFRIAFMSSDKETVWSANRAASASKYATAAAATSASTSNTAYTGYDLVATDQKGSIPAEGSVSKTGIATNTTYPNYLGQFPVGDGSTEQELTITLVAWFEGSDADVITTDEGEYDTVSAHMKFEARNLAA